jgi:hypothetical protein
MVSRRTRTAPEAGTATAEDNYETEAAIVATEAKPRSTAGMAKSRKDRLAEARKAAEEQADRDERFSPELAAPVLVPGKQMSLNDLNRMQRATNRAIRDEARDAANAAGKAAFEVLRGRNPKLGAEGVARRFRTVAGAQISAAKAAQLAALKAEVE